jgi:uncharacterized membrane protein YeaQ/YmgE (transglycosylase-associated protein family)
MHITLSGLFMLIIVGGLAGWIAGLIMHRRGFGIVGNIIVGIIGAAIGNSIMGMLGIYTGSLLGALLFAIIGAVLLLLAINAVFKKK